MGRDRCACFTPKNMRWQRDNEREVALPRNMSFALTTNQIIAREKDVTRRFGWWFLKPGDRLNAVKKVMGLRPGERVERICEIEVVSVRREPLNAITEDDVRREGFPQWTTEQFISMLVEHYGIAPDKICNRVEFRYL